MPENTNPFNKLKDKCISLMQSFKGKASSFGRFFAKHSVKIMTGAAILLAIALLIIFLPELLGIAIVGVLATAVATAIGGVVIACGMLVASIIANARHVRAQIRRDDSYDEENSARQQQAEAERAALNANMQALGSENEAVHAVLDTVRQALKEIERAEIAGLKQQNNREEYQAIELGQIHEKLGDLSGMLEQILIYKEQSSSMSTPLSDSLPTEILEDAELLLQRIRGDKLSMDARQADCAASCIDDNSGGAVSEAIESATQALASLQQAPLKRLRKEDGPKADVDDDLLLEAPARMAPRPPIAIPAGKAPTAPTAAPVPVAPAAAPVPVAPAAAPARLAPAAAPAAPVPVAPAAAPARLAPAAAPAAPVPVAPAAAPAPVAPAAAPARLAPAAAPAAAINTGRRLSQRELYELKESEAAREDPNCGYNFQQRSSTWF
jgi:hypothetical protein